MSASASKRKRKELEEQGLSAQAVAEQKAKEKKNKMIKNAVIVALAILVCVAAVFGVMKLVNRPKYDVKAPAVTVGEEKISVPVYDYFYNLAASNFYNSYSFLIQAGTPLSQQQSVFGEGTMEDYMKEMTSSNLKEILNVVAKAKANGYELSSEQKADIAGTLKSLETEASQYGFANADKYLAARFGDGCSTDNYEEYLKLYTIFAGYATKLNEEFQPSAEELNAAYEADKNAYDLVSFTYAVSSAESSKVETQKAPAEGENSESKDDATATTETPTTYTDEAKAAAKEKAEGYMKEMPEDASSATYNKSTSESYLSAEMAEWLFDEARKEGDVKVFAKDEKEINYYTVRFDGRDTNDYCLVNANVISIQKDKEEDQKNDASSEASKDTGDETTAEPKTAAEKRDALIAAISEGMSDEAFSNAVSALGYTANTNNYTRTYSVQEIRDFLFDENRKAGDLFTSYENDNYYYIVRYVSQEEETYRDQMVHDKLWSDYYEAIVEANEVVVDEELLKNAHTDLTFNAANSES